VDKTKPFNITKRQVWQAYKQVRHNGEGTGVDQQDWPAFDSDLSNHLYRLWNRLSSGSYMPPAVRLVEIEKSGGGKRPLGIPTVSDRIAQAVVKQMLEPSVEPLFHEDSYGYRPLRCAHDALARAQVRCWDYNWVLDVDIKSFFDTLDHDLLMKAVRRHTRERWVPLYIERWLKAPVRHPDGRLEARSAGVPQGGVISPLLANLYLHYAFDEWMKRHYPYTPFERYADDIVIHLRSQEKAKRLQQAVSERLKECALTVHPEKTRVIYCKDGARRQEYEHCSFTFLGYEFRARRSATRGGRIFCNFVPGIAKKALKRLSTETRQWQLHRRVYQSVEEIAQSINPAIRGWLHYYGKFRIAEMAPLFRVVNNRLVKWARQKHKPLRYNATEARKWLQELIRRNPALFAHWKAGFVII